LPRYARNDRNISANQNFQKDYAMHRQPAVYLLTNRPNGTLYTGVTSNLPKRIWQHKNKVTKGSSFKYNLTRLVYFELLEDMYQAISREKQLKAGPRKARKAKVNLIEASNPDWRDLYPDICS
jgi:putative endonuclease